MTQTVLIIDDEADIRDVVADILEDEGYGVLKAAHSEQAFAVLGKHSVDLIILDIWLENSDMDGIEILKVMKTQKSGYHNIPVLMISGHGNVEMAVNAMKIGAYDFIEKPFKIEHMLLTVARALEQGQLKRENMTLKDRAGIGEDAYKTKSPALQATIKSIAEQTLSDARVLITGNIGTGKSKFARYLHSISPRARHPFHRFSASKITADTIERLFHDDRYKNATVLIERTEAMPETVQGLVLKQLSVANGSTENAPRILCTATPAISDLLAAGKFSSALYDRIGIVKYNLPDLNDRVEDLPDLAQEFADSLCKDMDHPSITFGADSILLLQERIWPGNIRQLKCTIEWVILNHILAGQGMRPVSARDISGILGTQQQHSSIENGSPSRNPSPSAGDISGNYTDGNHMDLWLDHPLRCAREQFEREYLVSLLKRFRGNISQMSKHVDMERTALHRKLKSMDISYDTVIANNRTERKAG